MRAADFSTAMHRDPPEKLQGPSKVRRYTYMAAKKKAAKKPAAKKKAAKKK